MTANSLQVTSAIIEDESTISAFVVERIAQNIDRLEEMHIGGNSVGLEGISLIAGKFCTLERLSISTHEKY